MQTVTRSASQGSSTGVSCPQCGHSLELPLPKHNHPMRTVSCSCGEAVLVLLDARRFERRVVAIRGMYTVMSDSGLGGLVNLRDLSEGGVGFTMSRPCALQPGWLITLVFELGEKGKRAVIAKATVRTVQNRDVGCSFVNPEQVRQDILAYFQS